MTVIERVHLTVNSVGEVVHCAKTVGFDLLRGAVSAVAGRRFATFLDLVPQTVRDEQQRSRRGKKGKAPRAGLGWRE